MAKQKLRFREKLSSKGQNTDTLVKKLQELHKQLADLDQELVDVDSLNAVRKDLVNNSLLLHKDRGVKAYTACCLADILRLYAPDAPYTQPELRDIFDFFFRQLLAGLKSVDVPYYEQYFHLLESLSTVKSVVLVCDLPNADELMSSIFRDFFSIVRRDLAKKVDVFMADILVALIDECSALPNDALQTILAQFTESKRDLLQHGHQAALQLATTVCVEAADKLHRYISTHFSEAILAHTTQDDEDEQEEDFDQVEKAHLLIKRLHAAAPKILRGVIPLLETEMKAEAPEIRMIVTSVFGEMLGDPKSGGELMKDFPSAWNVWVARRNDRSAGVRLKFVEVCRELFTTTVPEIREAVEDALAIKLYDPDPQVRAAVCKLYSQIDYETALHHVSEKQLKTLAGRGVDKKPVVRAAAIGALSHLYNIAYPELENSDPSAIQQFSWIPKEILAMMNATNEVRPMVQEAVAENLLPLPAAGDVDEAAWTTRLLGTMRHLDERSLNPLLKLTGLQLARPTIFEHFVDACVENNGGVTDGDETEVAQVTLKLTKLIAFIAASHPDPQKAAEDLKAFAKVNEQRLYKLLKTCMDINTDLKSLVKATNDFTKRLGNSSAAIVPTMTMFLRNASLHLINTSSIPTLLQKVANGAINQDNPSRMTRAERAANDAQVLLTFVAKHNPALLRNHIGALLKGIGEGQKNERVITVCLQGLAAVMRAHADVPGVDSRTIEKIKQHALDDNHRRAKFAARFLAFNKKGIDHGCREVVTTAIKNLPSASPERLAAHLAVLAQFARFVPDAIEEKSDVIIKFLLNKVLLVKGTLQRDEEDDNDEEEWEEDADLSPQTRARVLALKVCRYRCLTFAAKGEEDVDKETALEVATPVLKMLVTLTEFGGSMGEHEDPKVKSRMRLQAAVSLLHLSTVAMYSHLITPKFIRLAVMVQDSCFNVRLIFMTKLISLLQPRKLHPRFNIIPFLVVHDPEAEVKNLAISYISTAGRRMPKEHKLVHLELIFIRLLHLLAHHPDFGPNHEELVDSSKYITFYLSLVGNADNISLLYHLAAKGKTVREADSPSSENFYMLCELAQDIIRARANKDGMNIETYPGKAKLPSDILRAPQSAEASKETARTVYLPPETSAWVAQQYQPAGKEKKERPEKKERERKRKAPVNGNGHVKRPRKKRHSESHDENSDSDRSDVEMADAMAPLSEDESDMEEEGAEEKLGRGARSRAKAKAKRRARASLKKDRSSPVSAG